MRAALLLCFWLVACDRAPARAPAPLQAGARLEQAAIAGGVISPITNPIGAYASDTDRACLAPAGAALRIGAAIDYGEGNRCLARGDARADGALLAVDFGSECRFEARIDGEGLAFPATVPAACDRLCTGRATLSALTAARLSASPTEARSMRAADGTALCAD